MAEFDIPKAGELCWRELRTKDLSTAMEFYSKLFGWTLEQTKVTPMELQRDNSGWRGGWRDDGHGS